jgi:hypothetical protein
MKNSVLYETLFGEKYTKEKYKLEPHNFSGTICGKPYCVRCGLIAMRNEFTQWSIDKGCLSEYHPQYETMRKRAGK